MASSEAPAAEEPREQVPLEKVVPDRKEEVSNAEIMKVLDEVRKQNEKLTLKLAEQRQETALIMLEISKAMEMFFENPDVGNRDLIYAVQGKVGEAFARSRTMFDTE